jgi:DNA-binding response OmpR family regulator
MKNQALIVHDSLTARMDLRSTLTAAGFSVAACGTLSLARKMLRDKACSLLILDVDLPDGNGLDFLRELRSTRDFEGVSVLLLAAEPEVQRRAQALGVDPDDCLATPYDRSDLARRACALVERRQIDLAAPASSSAASLVGKRILVVDDSPTYLEKLAQLLRRDGCHVMLARSGEETLELASAHPFDCVVMDLLMPGMGGMAAAVRIKATPALARLPVILLSGLDDPHLRAQGVAVGVDDFVLKSPDLPLLKARLRNLFRKKADDAPCYGREEVAARAEPAARRGPRFQEP